MNLATMANILDDEGVFELFLGLTGISANASVKLIAEEGVTTLKQLGALSKSEIDDLINGINKAYRTVQRAADRCNITLCGFVRGQRATVYTHPHRIEGCTA